ncbi:hypothetical protein DFH27DRAFT_602857 [Peziza echinospora]|nr:hypothetical protein DFH27DRAFT_602857 [Peziza echinospora]
MLNAFHARSICELGPKERVKIDSLLAYSDKLLLGLNNGSLRVYHVESPETPDVTITPIRTIEKFARGSIAALGCIKEASILISLSDSAISIFDLESFALQQTIAKTKGASIFALTTNFEKDNNTGIPGIVSRLAVGVKKRLLLYSWHDAGIREGKDISLSGNVRSLTWASERKIVAGLGSGGFVVVDIQTGAVEDVVPPVVNGAAAVAGKGAVEGAAPAEGGQWGWGTMGMGYMGMGMGWGSKPLSTRLKGDELLLVKDTTTLFIDSNGKAIPEKAHIPWPHTPDAIAYSYPYLISLHNSKQHLEVRNPATQSLLQTIQLAGVSTIHVPSPNAALLHAGKLFYVCSPTQVWRVGAVDYEDQIKQLIDMEKLDEAISVLEQLESVLLESKEERIKEVQMLKAQSLFEKRKYRESMELFANVEAPPERVIRLFPKIIAGNLSIIGEDKDDESEVEGSGSAHDTTGTPENGIAEHGVAEANGGGSVSAGSIREGETGTAAHDTTATGPATGEESAGEESKIPTNGHVIDAAPVIASLRKIVGDDASSIRSKKLVDDDAMSTRGSIRGSIRPPRPPIKQSPSILEERELRRAVNELTVYLGNSRLILTKFIEKLQSEQKHASRPSAAGRSSGADSPIRAPFGDSYFGRNGSTESTVDPLEKALQTAKLVHTTLFRAYMYTKPSLVGSLVRQPNLCDPEVVNERLKETGRFHDLVDFFGGKKLHREALTLLKQFGEAEEEDDRAPALHGPDRTVRYLQSLDSSHLDLIFEFAEWPLKAEPELGMEVFLTDSENAESLPRGKVLDYLSRLDRKLAIKYLEHLINAMRDMTPEFHTTLAGLYLEHIRGTKWTDASEKEDWKEKMLDFLRESKQYRSEKVLGWLPREDPDFYEARAIVLSNMGHHKAALEIYVFKLQDQAKAEEYCIRIHTLLPPPTDPAEAPSSTTVFHLLLSLYLRPQPPYPPTPQLDHALGILSRHGARIEPSEALSLIPEDMKIARLEEYFQRQIRHANSRVTENMVVAQLRKGEMWKKEEALVGLKGKKVVIGESRMCPVCHKRLGRSVVSVFPDGVVVHYGCGQGREE